MGDPTREFDVRLVLMATVIILGVAVPACEPTDPISDVVTRDSLGVVIVEHGRLSLDSVEPWRLASEPLLSVGLLEGSEAYELDGVIDAHLRRDGSIAVVDRSRTLRVYDRHGVHQWTAGRRGDGPGEFQYPQRIAELQDSSLVVWDVRLARLSLFVDPGHLVRTTALEAVAINTSALGMSGTGRLLVERREIERDVLGGQAAITFWSQLSLLDIETAKLHPLGRRLHSTQYQEVDENGAFSPAIFDVSAVLAPALDGFWYGDGKTYELRRSSADGDLSHLVRWRGADQRIAEADFDAVLETWTGTDATPETRQWMRSYGRIHPRAEQFPSYERLLTDDQGNLWVRDFVRDHEDDGTRRWIVFSFDGARVLGRFEHGKEFTPMRVSTESVLGVERDDLDIERVVLRRLVRAPG